MKIVLPALGAWALSMQASHAEPVQFKADDGVTIDGDYQGDGAGPIILLFHQASANRHEYDPIAPRLNALGFDTLAIDQRAGGGLFDHPNETAKGHVGSFIAALADLEAALAWSKDKSSARLVWGSSYSAALVFLLAAKRPDDVAAVLAFSPGEYLGGASDVKDAAAKVQVPVFITSSSDGDEVKAAKVISDAAASTNKVQFVPKHGVHGSSTLRKDANKKGSEENWQAVESFLAGLTG